MEGKAVLEILETAEMPPARIFQKPRRHRLEKAEQVSGIGEFLDFARMRLPLPRGRLDFGYGIGRHLGSNHKVASHACFFMDPAVARVLSSPTSRPPPIEG